MTPVTGGSGSRASLSRTGAPSVIRDAPSRRDRRWLPRLPKDPDLPFKPCPQITRSGPVSLVLHLPVVIDCLPKAVTAPKDRAGIAVSMLNFCMFISMQDRSRIEDAIQAQQIRLLYSQSTTAVVVSVGVALLTAYYFSNRENIAYVSTWVVFLILVSLSRLSLFHWFSIEGPKDPELGKWLRWHIVASFLGGITWGALGLFYDPGWATGQQVALLIVIAGIATSAISSYATVPVSYTHLTLPTTCTPCRSRWSPYH